MSGQSEATHIAGPWWVGDSNTSNPDCVGVWAKDGWVVADVWRDANALRETADANARLMAASPDLLAELRRSTAQMQIWVSINGDMVGALAEQIAANEAAIAKATSPTP